MKRACVLLFAAGAFAQAPPAFEVASIKPAPPITPESFRKGPPHLGVKIDDARADYGGMSIEGLIAYAYRVKTYQITGPDYIKSERFDILAKLPEGATKDQGPEMMQALLASRFKLVLHRESKEFPVYAMVAGKNGVKLTPKPDDYVPGQNKGFGTLTMESLASMMNTGDDRPVVDQTELKGLYLVPMQSVMNMLMTRAKARAEQSAASRNGGATAASDPADSGVFALVQEFGLKLEPRKLPLPYLTVDHVEKAPTEN